MTNTNSCVNIHVDIYKKMIRKFGQLGIDLTDDEIQKIEHSIMEELGITNPINLKNDYDEGRKIQYGKKS